MASQKTKENILIGSIFCGTLAGLALSIGTVFYNHSKIEKLNTKIPQVVSVESKIRKTEELMENYGDYRSKAKNYLPYSEDPNNINFTTSYKGLTNKLNFYKSKLNTYDSDPELKKVLDEREKRQGYLILGLAGFVSSFILLTGTGASCGDYSTAKELDLL